MGGGPFCFLGLPFGGKCDILERQPKASKIIGKRRKIRWTYADEVPTRAVSFPQGTGLAPPGFPCKQGRPGGARLSVPKYGRFRRGERPGMKPGRFAAARLFWSLPRCILTTGGETHETESDPEALRQLLERRDMCALRDAPTQTHPADLAELLDELDRPEMLAVFRALPKELAARCFPTCRRRTSRP